MTNTTTTAVETEVLGPLSLKRGQEVWIVVDEQAIKLSVFNFISYGKYVLKKVLDEPSMPYTIKPENVYTEEKAAWVTIESALSEARRLVDEKLADVSQRIAALS